MFYKDDNVLNLHGCLTTYKGLDDYHRHLAKLLSKANKKSLLQNKRGVFLKKCDFSRKNKSVKPNSTFRRVENLLNNREFFYIL